MPPKRTVTIRDIYLYDIPIEERRNLCQILLRQNVWQVLAIHMQYDESEIEEIKTMTHQTNDFEAEELLTRWGEQNHTVTELFVLLSRMEHNAAMNSIKNLVDSRYHRRIAKSQISDASNFNEKLNTKLSKEISEKILNGPMINIEKNESDKLSNGNEWGLTEGISAIPKIDYIELRDATNNWSLENVLGKGGFGTVFKGMWKNTPVAIKKIEQRGAASTEMGYIQIQQSLNELRHLNSCRHDNILPLYGHSMNGDSPCLVYQLMHGGSLEQRLFKRASDVSPLNWRERINIAIGTARGLQFLHTFQDNKRPIIHGDIKPANILLDDPIIQPKIGDFGLVREGNENTTIVSRLMGTRPYLPSEFLQYQKLTTKVDSFSFGIVLFELATGLRAYVEKSKGVHSYLIKTVQAHDKDGTLLQLIDKTAPNVEDVEEIYKTIINVGMNCTKKNYKERMDMVKVLTILQNSFQFTI